jgi:hypothetical protein
VRRRFKLGLLSAGWVLIVGPAAQAVTLSDLITDQFDALLVTPLGAITRPGQIIAQAVPTGRRLDIGDRVGACGAVALSPHAAAKNDDMLVTGEITPGRESGAADEVLRLFGLSAADSARVEAISYTFSGGIDAPQSKALARLARTSHGCGPNATLVTSVVVGVLSVSFRFGAGPRRPDFVALIKSTLDPTGRNFTVAETASTVTFESSHPLVIGANVEPLSAYRE